MTGVAIVSGGLDSVVLAHWLIRQGEVAAPEDLIMVSFDYGQRHAKELVFAQAQAMKLDAQHILVPMQFMASLLHGSSLTAGKTAVPDGHYAEDTMKATVVPNRNMIMLSIAAGIAVAEKAAWVATAVHAGDHFIYPDCRPEFIEAASDTITLATTDGFGHWDAAPIMAPFIDIPKDEIVRIGNRIGVDFRQTWSCYKGGSTHCGRCGTCVERQEAFALAGVTDPTDYLDSKYWKEVTTGGR